MERLMRFPEAIRHAPDVDAWFGAVTEPHRLLVQPWFQAMRSCGPDVRELIHDGCPVACVGDAAFGYVNAFRAHAVVGFFQGATLRDLAGLLQGTGKRMRHVKVRPGVALDEAALGRLIIEACHDMRRRSGALDRP
jgi:hypothetical protein